LVSTASIDDGWHLYAQEVPEDGPIATSFTFENPKNRYSLKGRTTEQEGVTIDDPVFGMKIKFFENRAIFRQKIQTKTDLNSIKGVVEFMVCDDTKCLAPTEIELVFHLKKGISSSTIKNKDTIRIDNKEVNTLLYGMDTTDMTVSSIKCQEEVRSSSTEIQNGGNSLWNLFGLGFLGGLLALLTPCVFPMIPLTVSFFTKKNGQNNRSGISKALLYGFFIFAVYVILSIPFHLLDSVNPDILNEISTNVWLNSLFFIVFVFFAFSFFGYYELTLPSSWTNTTTQGESSGGFIGIFFYGINASNCVIFMHRANFRIALSRITYSRRRCLAIDSRNGRFWNFSWVSFCFICFISQYD